MGMRWTRILSRGSSNTARHSPCWGNRDRLRPFGPLARRVRLCSFNFKVAWVAGVERAEVRGKERKGKGIGERRKEAPSSQVLFLPHSPPPSPLLRRSRWLWNAVRREWDCWVDGGLRALNRSFSWRLISLSVILAFAFIITFDQINKIFWFARNVVHNFLLSISCNKKETASVCESFISLVLIFEVDNK